MVHPIEYIVSDPGYAGGRPRIAGTRFAVKWVVINHLHQGMPLELIANDFVLPLPAVYAAMSYYYDHKDEIDSGIEADERFAEEFMRTHPSTLRPKVGN